MNPKLRTMLFRVRKNLFNKDTVTMGVYIHSVTGLPTEVFATYCVSDFIRVSPNTSYARSNSDGLFWWYTIDKALINRDTSGTTKTSPSNAYYTRAECLIENINIFQLEFGAVSTYYESY